MAHTANNFNYFLEDGKDGVKRVNYLLLYNETKKTTLNFTNPIDLIIKKYSTKLLNASTKWINKNKFVSLKPSFN